MRTLKFLVVLVALAIATPTMNAGNGYVITNDDTIICHDVALGITNARITFDNGETTKVDKEDVKSYMVNGRQYDKLPVYLNGKPTGETLFLELLCQRNGLRLYKHTYFVQSGWDTEKQKFEDTKQLTALLVYKDGNYYLQIDQKNAANLANFFHLEGLTVEN
jgi:hypothetical protein